MPEPCYGWVAAGKMHLGFKMVQKVCDETVFFIYIICINLSFLDINYCILLDLINLSQFYHPFLGLSKETSNKLTNSQTHRGLGCLEWLPPSQYDATTGLRRGPDAVPRRRSGGQSTSLAEGLAVL